MSTAATTGTAPSHIRALYRSILRELPSRPLSQRSPLHARIRSQFTEPPPSSSTSTSASDSHQTHRVQAAAQYVAYARAQREYAALLERYNPGMGMTEEERVRLTARRVGMDLPEEYKI